MDGDALHEGLSRLLLNDQERMQLGEGARKGALRFSPERMLRDTGALLEAVACGRQA
jgi:hypothetical protein